MYHAAWTDVLSEAYKFKDPISKHWEGTKDSVGAKPMASPCEVWTELYGTVSFKLAGRPESLSNVDDIYRALRESLGLRCTACERWIADWRADIKYRMGKVPKFSSFL